MTATAQPRWGVRSRLREATRREHDSVDALFSRVDLSRTHDYARFLGMQAAAYFPLERVLDRSGAEALLPDWPQRRRGAQLAADLSDLGVAAPPPVDPPILDSVPALLGAIYVLEGSRLGGAVLRRRVAPGAPVRFLGAAAPENAWTGLLALLDDRLRLEGDLAAAIDAARAAFTCFEQAGRGIGRV